jgi:hypothetical protein
MAVPQQARAKTLLEGGRKTERADRKPEGKAGRTSKSFVRPEETIRVSQHVGIKNGVHSALVAPNRASLSLEVV